MERLDKQLFLSRRPEHLHGMFSKDGPGKEYGIVGGNVVGGEKDAAFPGNILTPFDEKTVDGGGVKTDNVC